MWARISGHRSVPDLPSQKGKFDNEKVSDNHPLIAAAAFAAEGYKVITKYKIGGTGGWDYVAVDQVNRRIYASHATTVEVLDADSGKVLGQIAQLHGVHGIAVAADLNKGFITNGTSNSVTVFDLKTRDKVGELRPPIRARTRFVTSPRRNGSSPSTEARTTPARSTPKPTRSSAPSSWAESRSSASRMAPESCTTTSKTARRDPWRDRCRQDGSDAVARLSRLAITSLRSRH